MSYWGTTKPPYGTALAGGAMSANLLAVYAFNEDTGTVAHNAVTAAGGDVTMHGTALVAMSSGGGLTINASGAGAYATAPAALKISPPLSWFLRLKHSAAADAGATLFSCSYDNTGGSPTAGYICYYDGSVAVQDRWNDGSASRGFAFGVSPPTNGTIFTLGGSITHTPSDLATSYYNGASSNSSTASIPATIAYTATSQVVFGQGPWAGTANARATVNLLYVFGRSLSAAEFSSLHSDPYQLFAVPEPFPAGYYQSQPSNLTTLRM